jgi:hypothetical protein
MVIFHGNLPGRCRAITSRMAQTGIFVHQAKPAGIFV